MVSHMIAIALINYKSCASLTGCTNESGSSSSSTTSNNIVMDIVSSSSADKAVKAILPFLKELSEVDWWTGLLVAWIEFEVEGPPKSVS
jgi:ABC-type phosphate/phosphonate transport system substrate-binding protein